MIKRDWTTINTYKPFLVCHFTSKIDHNIKEYIFGP